MALNELTGKQKKFVIEYMKCLNASEAARRAGYAKSSAHVRGHELVRNSKVAAIIQDEFNKQSMTPEEITSRLAAQARGDIFNLIDPGTLTLDWDKALEAGATHLIKKIKQTIITKDDQQTEIFEIELYDSQKALVHLGKTYALFADKLKVEDWQDRAIEDIRHGNIDYKDLEKEFDSDLATQLFTRAGVPISTE